MSYNDFKDNRQYRSSDEREQGVRSIQDWLVAKLAELLDTVPSAIDIAEPFASYGLESVDVVGLSGELEEWLKREMPPTLLYDYPNIKSLAHYLATDMEVIKRGTGSGTHAGDRTEPIAIIGIGCRFPGAKDAQAFWQLLCDGVDAISEVPAERWDVTGFYSQDMLQPGKMNTRWGGFLEQVDRFDAQFFGISPREAERMDPQQRLLLEVVWEALEDAGQVAESLAGSRTGVFIGIANSDYSRIQFSDPELSDAYAGTGSAYSIAANRISYLLDWHGPSMAIDTACSSSLVAVHLACQSLWRGEATLALAGGVNLILSPELTVNFTKAGFMAPDGRCKAFDARANGYVRGEGAGVIVLKPLPQALAEGDPVYAVIRGSAVNQDGRSNGLTAPNRQSQEAVLLQAYQMAGVSPGQVQYVEAHGTGTALGDPIEAAALGHVLAIDRSPAEPCLLGSVKTNIGHLEAAAGIAGLIKVALSLKHGKIPPGLHFSEPNPYISFTELPLRVQTTLAAWPPSQSPALAGVSSFGFGGTNAHIVLEETPRTRATSSDHAGLTAHRPYLLPLSARSSEALQSLARAYLDFLGSRETGDTVSLADICYTASTRRSQHDYRLAITARTREELCDCLERYLQGEQRPGVQAGRKARDGHPQLVFVFPGQGSQWIGMGRQLLKHEPVFAEMLASCEEAMRLYVDWSLHSVLTSEEGTTFLERIDVIQPTLFAIQVALAALWRSFGVVPDAVVGHSMGEVAAAHVAGALSLQDAARIICLRSKLLRRVSGQGAMAVVELSLEQAEQVVSRYAHRLSVAVSNSPRSTVLSGEPAALEEVLEMLEKNNIFCRRVNVDVASHSPQMDPLRDELLAILDGLQPQRATIRIYSTVTGSLCSGQELVETYWVRNLRDPVHFATVLQELVTKDYTLYLELSPHPILLPAIEEGLRYCQREGVALPSMRRLEEEQAVLLESLGTLYAQGYPVDWYKLYAKGGRCVPLPSYPWQRERFWIEPAKSVQELRGTVRQGGHPLLGVHLESSVHSGTHYWEDRLNFAVLPYLHHHRVEGQVVMPASAYLEMALAAAREVFGPELHVLEEVTFAKMLALTEGSEQSVQVVLSPGITGMVSFQIASRIATRALEEPGGWANGSESGASWTVHASGTIQLPTTARVSSATQETKPADPITRGTTPEEIRGRCTESISGSTFYEMLRGQGLEHGASFQAVEQIWRREGEAIARLRMPEEVLQHAHSYAVHPALLDSCFQVFGAAISHIGNQAALTPGIVTYLPVGLKSLRIHMFPTDVTGTLWSHVLVKSYETQGTQPTWIADLHLLDDQGRVLLEVRGLSIQRFASETPGQVQKALNNWLYTLAWHPLPRHQMMAQEIMEIDIAQIEHTEPASQGGSWLIFTDRGSVGQQLQALLQARGERCIVVSPGKVFEQVDAEHYHVNPVRLPDFLHLLENVYGDNSSLCAGIVHLWSLESTPCGEITPAELEAAQQQVCGSALYLVQALFLVGWRNLPRLWLVTQGTQAIEPETSTISIAQSTLWGLGRTIALEHPLLQSTLVDLSPSAVHAEEITNLIEELLGRDLEGQLALRGKTRYVARLEHYVVPSSEEERVKANDQPFRLEIGTPGILDHLSLHATTRRKPEPGEVEIEVMAAGLNFLDVLKALGVAPRQEPGAVVLGAECAGKITAVGSDVEGFVIGDEVVALAEGCIGTHVTTSVHCVAAKPPRLSFEQAAAIPVVFLTAYYALNTLAKITRGERVLIHSAAGGTGLAAVQLARVQGAEVFATAGSPEKREFLRSSGIEHVTDSRSLTFAEEVLAATQGQGVDVVLNSLTGAAMAKSLSILRPFGRFVELGKKDIYANSSLELFPFHNNLSYYALDLVGMVRARPEKVGALLREIMQSFQAGLLEPLPASVFAIGKANEAFVMMAQARHIGKLVISLEKRAETVIHPLISQHSPIRADGTYLISGGLGGIGLKVAQWLVERGARQLVLLGRGSASARVEEHLATLTANGAHIKVARVDISKGEQVASLLEAVGRSMPPLRGIMHMAGILDDGLVLNMDEERFRKVLEPKMLGAWNLHILTQSMPLDFFVMFSSAAALLGSPGQGNYAAANAFLDALAHYRQALKLPALSINWGPWSDVGLAVASTKRGGRLGSMGIASLSPEQGLDVLDKLLRQRTAQVCVIPLNLRQWRQSYPQAARAPFLSHLVEKQGVNGSTHTSPICDALLAAELGQRRQLLEEHLREQIARVLRLSPASIDAHTALSALGFDSLMALELRNRLEDSLGVTLPTTVAWSHPTIAALSGYLAEKMGIALESSKPHIENMEAPQLSPGEEEDIVKMLEILQEFSSKELS